MQEVSEKHTSQTSHKYTNNGPATNVKMISQNDNEHDAGSAASSMNDNNATVEEHDDSMSQSELSDDCGSRTGSSSGSSNKKFLDELAQKEAKAVRVSKIVMLVVLAISALLAGTLTYHFARRSEKSIFYTQFEDFAFEISDVTVHNVKNVFALIESFGNTITSCTLGSQDDFPLITVPHFEVRGESFKKVSSTSFIAIAPKISDAMLEEWNQYSSQNQGWIKESYELQGDAISQPQSIHESIFERTEDGNHAPLKSDFYCPLWQQAAAPQDTSYINSNLMGHDFLARVIETATLARKPALSEVVDPRSVFGDMPLNKTQDGMLEPTSILVEPIFGGFDEQSDSIVGFIVAVVPWVAFLQHTLRDDANGVLAVLRSSCGDTHSFRIDGTQATYLTAGDVHDPKYDELEHVVAFLKQQHCLYDLHLFPTKHLEYTYYTSTPAMFATVVVVIFIFTTAVFLSYDWLVRKQHKKIQKAATKSNAIVSSLFPAEIRDRLFHHNDIDNLKREQKSVPQDANSKSRLKRMLDSHGKDSPSNEDDCFDPYEKQPIADLFPNATVIFADISGFTAWSSVREPSQVFILLETVYRAFDHIAKKLSVFKVETVGDCYVAVTGLPVPRDDHAVVMARFARDCMKKMQELSRSLEVSLGPDTGDLAMRFGMHSGPVTAGVLRGAKSRFQLFGDTVNVAARIEESGTRNRIHLSQDTADLLRAAGKQNWLVARSDMPYLKGKGVVKTFWLTTRHDDSSKSPSVATEEDALPTIDSSDESSSRPQRQLFKDTLPANAKLSPKMMRLVNWNVDVLSRLLKTVVAKRNSRAYTHSNSTEDSIQRLESAIGRRGNPLDDFAEMVNLPEFDEKSARTKVDPSTVLLPKQVLDELEEYVKAVASIYRVNPFHNFEHASHVMMSVSKLLSRIVAPDINDNKDNLAETLHDHTYGITSDPLTQFSVVLSALIHDAGHVGIPNYLLIGENTNLANHYRGKSVAEQNSVDTCWTTLMQPRFAALRGCIYEDKHELLRFRQLLVNTVLATDIFDAQLQAMRRKRWEKAFSSKINFGKTVDNDRKATIVIEHLIQASDVAHTMQHWHVYQKWNERLFAEMMLAFKTGRSNKDPSAGWYEGELGFFDNYIIPLAKKLKDCGVFGVSSDEYLNYALENRREWEAKGEAAVQAMLERYNAKEDAQKSVDSV